MAARTARSEWGETFRALRHRDFRLYAAGMTVSLVGSWMQGVAQSWLMYRLTHSEFLLGLTFFCTHIPVLLLSPLGGLAADRYPRRRIVLITQMLALAQAVALAWLTFTGQVTTTHVLVLALVLGILNAFDIPGRHTLFVQMVGKPDLISAIALNSAIFNVARVLGPSAAGLVVALWGEAVCFLVNAASFLAMIFCLLRMHMPAAPPAPAHADSPLSGFHYVWSHPPIRMVLAMSGALNLTYGPILALGPFFADGIFQQGSQGLGFLIGAMGVGAVVGVLHLGREQGIGQIPAIILQSSMLMAAATMVFAWSPWYSLSLAVMPVIGFSVMRQNAGGNSLIQTVVPDAYRGRVIALYSMVVTGLLPLGSLAAGAFAKAFGPRPVICGAALFCLLAALWFRSAHRGFHEWVKQQEEVCAV